MIDQDTADEGLEAESVVLPEQDPSAAEAAREGAPEGMDIPEGAQMPITKNTIISPVAADLNQMGDGQIPDAPWELIFIVNPFEQITVRIPDGSMRGLVDRVKPASSIVPATAVDLAQLGKIGPLRPGR